MKSFLKVSLFFISFFFFQNLFAALSPVGFWKTIDDETGKPKAVIQIWQAANDTLNGRILKIWPRPGYDQNEKCQACTGSRRNQRIVGMVVLQDLRQSNDSPNLWIQGRILDPKNGKTYHCNFLLSDNGKTATVRGYIGIPLFGRSQTWLRVSNAAGE